MRCSDAERERTSSALYVAAGEGRLSMDEVEERLVQVYTARYRHELEATSADLPAPAAASAGWRPIATMARRQLAAEVAALTGRGAASRRHRVVLALAAFAMVLFFVVTVTLALHGIAGDGPEHHDFGAGRGPG
ncbi:DUF1707 domain-containing protein [Amycolatopsis acidiphila]|uniref:DUF1707 domain-containing protein n=1 Tax=Amycolatopsis acidiphila TaxID=715473 RepID=UPI001F303122|nr:DUF1707 domain-containing protein [Amycolatopsis acidiphila]UIJ63845.1 DUF1707 domain-containing protein [Amycolatopsis acidiphila]